MPESFSIKSRLSSVGFACQGIADLLRTQHNARIHLVAALLVVGLAWFFDLQRWEWAVLLLAVGGVWMAEALNTAVEHIADALHPEHHPLIKRAKDVAAAAVLLFAMVTLVIGVLIFYPYLESLVVG